MGRKKKEKNISPCNETNCVFHDTKWHESLNCCRNKKIAEECILSKKSKHRIVPN